MIVFDKSEIREQISIEQIYDLLNEWGGDPQYTNTGIIASTICHNEPGQGSHKLYYYTNTGLFQCYTGCAEPTFDIYQLCMKVMLIQRGIEFDLNDAVRWIAARLGINGAYQEEDKFKSLEDWKIFDNYSRIQSLNIKTNEIPILKEYDNSILQRFNYEVKLKPWLEEDISQEVLTKAGICFYPGDDQIIIPHYDINNRLVGIRGRSMCKAESEIYGKYRPIRVGKQWFNHPLGMNLYGINWAKNNIKVIKKAIVFEAEKSALKYASYFGWDNNISVACCGSNLSLYQYELLVQNGAEEIVLAFDRQFQELGDKEFQHLKNNLLKTRMRFKNHTLISFMFDKNMITDYKASPIDEGKEKFLQLFKERIII